MILTLGGHHGAGKSTLGKKLAEHFGYKRYSTGDFMRELALERGISLIDLGREAENDNGIIDKILDDRQITLGKNEDNFIIDGRLAFHFIPNSIKIFLTVEPFEAAKRIFEDESRAGVEIHDTIEHAAKNIIIRRKLSEKSGNNAFAWEEREKIYPDSPFLTIPSLIVGTIDDVTIGDTVVFEEMDSGILKSCTGLKHFVKILNKKKPRESITRIGTSQKQEIPEIVVFDNHNHALYFWIDAVRRGIIDTKFELIHIDEHSDLWHNENTLNLDEAIADEQIAWEFVNHDCNVGNYIEPAIQSGLVGNMIRIENEFQMDEYMNYSPPNNSILNLDLDIFSEELSHIPHKKIIRLIQNLLSQVQYVTIATSPYFIDQGASIEHLRDILK